MKKKDIRKKRSLTLIEMIVVMLLIATITGALAYNYRASLDEGKAFKTKEAISRITTILNLALAEEPTKTPNDIASSWDKIIKKSPLAGNKAEDFEKDGWGQKFSVSAYEEDGLWNFKVESKSLQDFEARKNK